MWEMEEPAPDIHTLLLRICDYGGWPGEGGSELPVGSVHLGWKRLLLPL